LQSRCCTQRALYIPFVFLAPYESTLQMSLYFPPALTTSGKVIMQRKVGQVLLVARLHMSERVHVFVV
jgi:hypothetical protein